jgi:hypothetical protein
MSLSQANSIDEIYCELLKNSIASEKALWHIAMPLSALPQEILEFALKNCAFIILNKEERGLSIDSTDPRLTNREHLIFLPAGIWSEEARILAFVIVRQIAYGYIQYRERSEKTKNRAAQERAADHKAIEWLSARFPKSSFDDLLFKEPQSA